MDWLIFGALFGLVLYAGHRYDMRHQDALFAELDRRYRAEHGGRSLFGEES